MEEKLGEIVCLFVFIPHCKVHQKLVGYQQGLAFVTMPYSPKSLILLLTSDYIATDPDMEKKQQKKAIIQQVSVAQTILLDFVHMH